MKAYLQSSVQQLKVTLKNTSSFFVLSMSGFYSLMSLTDYNMAAEPSGIKGSARMNPEEITLSEKSQAGKEKYRWSHPHVESKNVILKRSME